MNSDRIRVEANWQMIVAALDIFFVAIAWAFISSPNKIGIFLTGAALGGIFFRTMAA